MMDIIELIQRYNQALQQGMTSDDFAESVGMKRKSIQQQARRKGYIFDKEINRYIKPGEDVELLDPVEHKKEIKLVHTQQKQNKTNKELDVQRIYKELERLTKRIEILENEKVKVQEVASTCEGQQGLRIRKFNGEPMKQISYRWHSEVLERLEKVCEKYPHYTKTAILNSILIEGLDTVLCK